MCHKQKCNRIWRMNSDFSPHRKWRKTGSHTHREKKKNKRAKQVVGQFTRSNQIKAKTVRLSSGRKIFRGTRRERERALCNIRCCSNAILFIRHRRSSRESSTDKFIEYSRCLLEPWQILQVVVVRWRRWWPVIGTRTMAADRYGTGYRRLNGGGWRRSHRSVRNVLLLLMGLAMISGGALMRSIGDDSIWGHLLLASLHIDVARLLGQIRRWLRILFIGNRRDERLARWRCIGMMRFMDWMNGRVSWVWKIKCPNAKILK